MTRLLVMSAAALGLMAGIATAQTSETIITATPAPAPAVVVPPPPNTVGTTTTTQKSVGPDGSVAWSQSTTYPGAIGPTLDTSTNTYPPVPRPPVTTQQTTTTTH